MKSLIALKNKINHNKVVKVCVIIILFSLNLFAQASDDVLHNYFKNRWNLSTTQVKYLKNGEILAKSTVLSTAKTQTFNMKASAFHPKKCSKVIRKLSMLEEYSKWIDFIKSSTFNESLNLYTITADHTLLPYPMLIHINVKRPTKVGLYPFSFPTGMFKGLTGEFEVREVNKRCLFYATAFWSGQNTKIPDFAIELFTETLSKIGGSILMRKVN